MRRFGTLPLCWVVWPFLFFVEHVSGLCHFVFCSPFSLFLQIFPFMSKERWHAVRQLSRQVAKEGHAGSLSSAGKGMVISDTGDSVLVYTTTCTTLGTQYTSELEIAPAAAEDRELVSALRVKVRHIVSSSSKPRCSVMLPCLLSCFLTPFLSSSFFVLVLCTNLVPVFPHLLTNLLCMLSSTLFSPESGGSVAAASA